jgi:hypothetical protein
VAAAAAMTAVGLTAAISRPGNLQRLRTAPDRRSSPTPPRLGLVAGELLALWTGRRVVAIDTRHVGHLPRRARYSRLGPLVDPATGKRQTIWALSIVPPYRRASLVLASNRSLDEWIGLFDDPILGDSALDGLANGADQVVIEGSSYRAKLAPNTAEGD